MENRTILSEWFDRVDSQKTGNITAAQLKVQCFLLPLFLFLQTHNWTELFICDINYWFIVYIRSDDQSALAVGNLNFSLSVVQQMIRYGVFVSLGFGIMLPICLYVFWFFEIGWRIIPGCMISTEMELWALKVSSFHSSSSLLCVKLCVYCFSFFCFAVLVWHTLSLSWLY